MFKKSIFVAINTKIAVIIGIIIAIISISIVAFSYNIYKVECLELKAQTALAVTESIASTIDVEKYLEIVDTNERTEYYNQLQDMADVARVRTDVTYLYSMVKTQDGKNFKYIFAGSANGLDGRDDFGVLEDYENYSVAPLAYLKQRSTTSDIYYAGEHYGWLLSAFSPIYDEKSQVVGLICADISAADVMHEMTEYRNKTIIIVALLILMFVILALYFTKIFFGKRIELLVDASLAISAGNLDYFERYPIENTQIKDEISTLTDTFKEMICQMNVKIQNEKKLAKQFATYTDLLNLVDGSHENISALSDLLSNIGGLFNFERVILFEVDDNEKNILSMWSSDFGKLYHVDYYVAVEISKILEKNTMLILDKNKLDTYRNKFDIASEIKTVWIIPVAHETKCVFISLEMSTDRSLIEQDETALFSNLGKIVSNYLIKIALSEKLTQFTAELELTVQKRTNELSKMTNKAEKAAKAKTQFLANMSHEIRTPMNAIIGMSELLMNANLNNRQLKHVNDIKTSACSLLEIINSILDISKIEAGKLELTPIHYNFRLAVENIVSVISYISKDKGLDFIIEINDNIPTFLYGDDGRLRQILLNILGNAVKFTKVGFVKLNVSSNKGEILFKISDSGIGMKKSDLTRLFGAFEQLDTMKNRTTQGTGLGLSISKGLIEMMGGTISVDSVYGMGCTFHIAIPFMLGDASLVQKHDETFKFISAPTARILVVDDNEINLNVAGGLLELCNIQCETATSGAIAIEKIQQNEYDLVFIDHMMPVMDGTEATVIIRSLGYDNLPIIALTANAIHGAKELLISAGMNDFLSKPIDKKLLNSMLRKWLPKEKVEFVENSQYQTRELSDFLQSISKISDIDIDLGLNYVGNAQKVYENSFKLFVKGHEYTFKKIESYYKNHEWPDFAIEIHGLKSALASLGHINLSEGAKNLEFAAKEHEIDYINDKYPDFCVEVNNFASMIEKLLLSDNATIKPHGDPQKLEEFKTNMMLACDSFNISQANALLTDIMKFNFDAKNYTLEHLQQALDRFDFELGLTIIEEL